MGKKQDKKEAKAKRAEDPAAGDMGVELKLHFRSPQRPYVAKLVKWMLQEEVFEFQMENDYNDHPNWGVHLTITTHNMGNLSFLHDKMVKLFPFVDYDD